MNLQSVICLIIIIYFGCEWHSPALVSITLKLYRSIVYRSIAFCILTTYMKNCIAVFSPLFLPQDILWHVNAITLGVFLSLIFEYVTVVLRLIIATKLWS